eukprot:scaffold69290_cov45-Attheya_sp.AAC.2
MAKVTAKARQPSVGGADHNNTVKGRPPAIPVPRPMGTNNGNGNNSNAASLQRRSVSAPVAGFNGSSSVQSVMSNMSSSVSRDLLKESIEKHQKSLTRRESVFLEHLVIHGDDFEIELAREKLSDSELFFEYVCPISKGNSLTSREDNVSSIGSIPKVIDINSTTILDAPPPPPPKSPFPPNANNDSPSTSLDAKATALWISKSNSSGDNDEVRDSVSDSLLQPSLAKKEGGQGQPPHVPNHAPSQHRSSDSVGSAHRENVLQERRNSSLHGKLWKAHETGLVVTTGSSKRRAQEIRVTRQSNPIHKRDNGRLSFASSNKQHQRGSSSSSISSGQNRRNLMAKTQSGRSLLVRTELGRSMTSLLSNDGSTEDQPREDDIFRPSSAPNRSRRNLFAKTQSGRSLLVRTELGRSMTSLLSNGSTEDLVLEGGPAADRTKEDDIFRPMSRRSSRRVSTKARRRSHSQGMLQRSNAGTSSITTTGTPPVPQGQRRKSSGRSVSFRDLSDPKEGEPAILPDDVSRDSSQTSSILTEESKNHRPSSILNPFVVGGPMADPNKMPLRTPRPLLRPERQHSIGSIDSTGSSIASYPAIAHPQPVYASDSSIPSIHHGHEIHSPRESSLVVEPTEDPDYKQHQPLQRPNKPAMVRSESGLSATSSIPSLPCGITMVSEASVTDGDYWRESDGGHTTNQLMMAAQAAQQLDEQLQQKEPAWTTPVTLPRLGLELGTHVEGDESRASPRSMNSSPLSTDKPVLLREASVNLYQGEGIEVSDFDIAVEALKVDSIEHARQFKSMVSSVAGDTASQYSRISHLSSTGSYDDNIADHRDHILPYDDSILIRRMFSDDDAPFFGQQVHDSHGTDFNELFRSEPIMFGDDQASWGSESDMDEENEEHFDAWNVMKDEEAIGYGAGDSLPFLILGTSADDVSAYPHVLSPPLMESLQFFFPYVISEENYWMQYSLVRDGASMHTLLQNVRGAKHTILAIETTDGEVFGSFTSSPWRKNWKYYGNGEAFLWRMRQTRKTPCHSIIDQAQLESELDVYPWTGENNFVQLCTQDKIAVGGGGAPTDFTEGKMEEKDGMATLSPTSSSGSGSGSEDDKG